MKRARLLGAILQGVVLATLLLYAIVGMLNAYGGTRVFRYQGF